ncbi:MAG: diaminopimelate epimerase [Acidobacteriota bacterium]|nr:diaminopimelate epimerase [Acidobacteriota bacterium]
MTIPFCKAHGAGNDFLLTWANQSPASPEIARAICDRHTGIGADGWILVDRSPSIRIFNSDGSEPEISGNGTRCAAAFLIQHGAATGDMIIRTGAGEKHLRLLDRKGMLFSFEMNMGIPHIQAETFLLRLSTGVLDVTLVDVGNPQCAVPVNDFEFDWRSAGAEIEGHGHFPKRTNVSFFRIVDDHTMEVRFFERGAGETMSSGTGSTGAAAAAICRSLVKSPVRVLTPAGPLDIRSNGDLHLTGPAEITAEGVFHYKAEAIPAVRK